MKNERAVSREEGEFSGGGENDVKEHPKRGKSKRETPISFYTSVVSQNRQSACRHCTSLKKNDVALREQLSGTKS